MANRRRLAMMLAVIGLVVAIAGNLFALAAVHTLWSVPRGSAIRPMGVAGAMFLAMVATPIVALLPGIAAVVRGRRWIYFAPLAVTLVLSLLPSPLSVWYLNHIALTNHLIFQP